MGVWVLDGSSIGGGGLGHGGSCIGRWGFG